MAETSAGDAKATERLHAYWVHGVGAAKIRWGQPGDFDRCVLELGKYIRDPQGYCNLAHHEATGMYPAQHAAMEKHAGRAAPMADSKPYGDVKYADPKHGKYPVDTADHAKAAWSYINMPKNASQYPADGVTLAEVKAAIMAACKKFGVDVATGDSAPASRSEAVFFRTYELEDIRVIKRAEGDGSGRLVEAYAAVFNVPAEIRDHEGHYNEENDPTAFNRSIDHAARASRSPFRCIYNHGMTLHGTPAERFSIPIGTPEEVRAETRGLLTRTLYNKTPLADEILEAVISGGITAQSYSGRIIRSTPQLRPGEKYRPRGGQLPTVRRVELGLREYGPTPFPAFSGAEILGVRMSTPGSFGLDPDEHEEYDPGTAPDGAPAAGDPLDQQDQHSARYHQHQLYLLRAKEQREAAGLAW